MSQEKFPAPNESSGGDHNLHRIERISEIEAEVFSLLIPRFNELRIDMNEFEGDRSQGKYTREEIDHDRRNVEQKKNKLDQSDPSHQRAQILEALLAEQIELSEWFGKDVMTIIPAEYDDVYHAIDIAAEFQADNELSYLGLGVDITSSPGSLGKKMGRVKDHIRDGSLTEMKYFTSERLPDIHKRMPDIPNTVIGADVRTIRELCGLWLVIYKAKHPDKKLNHQEIDEIKEKAREAQQRLAKHRIQVMILTQIRDQLLVYRDYAKKYSKLEKRGEIIAKYDRLIAQIGNTLTEKKISKRDEELNESDDVYRGLKKELETFSSIE